MLYNHHQSLGWALRAIGLAGILTLTPAATGAGPATVIYVDVDAAPGGDGSSWAAAFDDLTDAIVAADPTGTGAIVDELWVAEGIYTPVFEFSGGDARSVAFWLPKGLAILGGFVGNEINASERNPATNSTVLSGELGVPGDPTDNSWNVIWVASFVDNTAVLDGFTITGGYAVGGNERGGGAQLNAADPVFVNCIFSDNYSIDDGGAVFGSGSPTFIDCTFIDNECGSQGAGGGAIACTDPFTLTRCTFQNNYSDRVGGAIWGGPITMVDCIFDGNSSSGSGGAVSATSFIQATNCIFRNNQTTFNRGGAISSGATEVVLIGCSFVNNSSLVEGGAIDARNVIDGTTLIGCTFLGNTGSEGGAVIDRSDALSVINCTFSGNTASANGGAISSINTLGTTIINSTFAANTASLNGGGISVTDVTIANSIFWENADSGGTNEASQIRATGSLSVNYSTIQGLTGGLGGVGNVDLDPLLVAPLGADLTVGTEDDDLRLLPGSPCIDAGDNTTVPPDVHDIDGNANTTEPLPLDGYEGPRFLDDVDTPDTGNGTPPIVDIGAYEFDGTTMPPVADGEYVGPSGGSWFVPAHWGAGAVPDSSTNVLIGATVMIDQPGAVANSVHIESTGTLIVASGSLVATSLLIEAGGELALIDLAAYVEVQTITALAGYTLQWTAGTIRLLAGGTWDNTGQAISFGCAGPATLIAEAGTTVIATTIDVCDMGVLSGSGTLTADVNNAGQVSPGSTPGILIIDGAYVQLSTGTLTIELADYVPGTGFDQLVATVSATLDGTLDVVLLGGFIPELAGDARIVVAPSIAGTFATESIPGLPGTFILDLQYNVRSDDASNLTVQLLTTLSATGPRLHVNQAAGPGGDGQSWATATNDLQAALAFASMTALAGDEIWVAASTYTPDGGSSDRFASFALPVNGVAVYGGFAGNENLLSERDIVANPTILSGDLNGNDGPGFLNNDENSYHVVDASGTTSTASLDGFTITGGNADGPSTDAHGGGIFNLLGDLTIANCTFSQNEAIDKGGAIYIDQGSPTVVDCDFDDNRAGNGGAVHNAAGSTPSITSCCFTNNLSWDDGGAVSNFSCAPVVTNCDFVVNSSFFGNAGAMFNTGADVLVTGCSFTNNTAAQDGGAVRNFGTTAVFDNCTFDGNSSTGKGGAVLNTSASTTTYLMCTFSINHANNLGGAMRNEGGGMSSLTGCDFISNTTDNVGGGLNAATADTTLTSCSFTTNMAAVEGGGLSILRCLVTLDGTSFSGNIAPSGSGIFNRAGDLVGGASMPGNDELLNGGYLFPGLSASPLVIAGLYKQRFASDFLYRIPQMSLDIGGTTPGVDFPVVSAGAADLDGTLLVNLTGGFIPQPGDELEILTTPSLVAPFDVAYSPSVPDGLRMAVLNEPTAGVSIRFEAHPDVIAFEDGFQSAPAFSVRDAVTGDFDGDGMLDVLLLLSTDGGFGVLRVLRNAGVGGIGGWNGFVALPPVSTPGLSPARLAVGLFNADNALDVAVADLNVATTSVAIFFNKADGSGGFDPAPSVEIGGPQSRISAGRVIGGAVDDIVVDLAFASNEVLFLVNDGAGSFSVGQTINTSGTPDMELADVDNDTHADLISFGSLTVHRFNPVTSMFEAHGSYAVDQAAGHLHVTDLNNDGFLDIATVGFLGDQLVILVNRGDGSGTFGHGIVLSIGEGPFSIASIDAEADGDQDLVIAMRNAEPSIQLLRNDVNGGETIGLGKIITLPGTADPFWVLGGDVDGDSVDEIIIADADGSVVVRFAVEPCPSDITGDGVTNVLDLIDLLLCFGQSAVPGCEAADVNGDGTVNVLDLIGLLLEFGQACP